MSQRVRSIEESKGKVVRLGKRLSVLFAALLVADCAAAIAFVAFVALAAAGLLGGIEGDGAFGQGSGFIPALAAFVAVGAVLLESHLIARDISKDSSPFTVAHARRIKVIGWVFVANALVELLASPGFAAVILGPFEFVVQPSASVDFPVLPVDVGAIAAAIVSFSLSAVWRYGSLIQSQVDDLV